MRMRAGGKHLRINVALASMLSIAARDSKGLQTMTERHWGEKIAGIALSSSVPKATFKRSEDIVLDIILKNFGEKPVAMVVRSPWLDYPYPVRNSRGQQISMNEFGQQRAEVATAGRKSSRDLKVGESQTDDIELSKAFN